MPKITIMVRSEYQKKKDSPERVHPGRTGMTGGYRTKWRRGIFLDFLYLGTKLRENDSNGFPHQFIINGKISMGQLVPRSAARGFRDDCR